MATSLSLCGVHRSETVFSVLFSVWILLLIFSYGSTSLLRFLAERSSSKKIPCPRRGGGAPDIRSPLLRLALAYLVRHMRGVATSVAVGSTLSDSVVV